MWRATILCSVGPFYKHRPINLDTPQRSIAHARTYTRDIIRTMCAGSSSDFVLFSELLTAYNRFGRVYCDKKMIHYNIISCVRRRTCIQWYCSIVITRLSVDDTINGSRKKIRFAIRCRIVIYYGHRRGNRHRKAHIWFVGNTAHRFQTSYIFFKYNQYN